MFFWFFFMVPVALLAYILNLYIFQSLKCRVPTFLPLSQVQYKWEKLWKKWYFCNQYHYSNVMTASLPVLNTGFQPNMQYLLLTMRLVLHWLMEDNKVTCQSPVQLASCWQVGMVKHMVGLLSKGEHDSRGEYTQVLTHMIPDMFATGSILLWTIYTRLCFTASSSKNLRTRDHVTRFFFFMKKYLSCFIIFKNGEGLVEGDHHQWTIHAVLL